MHASATSQDTRPSQHSTHDDATDVLSPHATNSVPYRCRSLSLKTLRRLLESNLGLEDNALDGKDTKEFIKDELDKVSIREDVFSGPLSGSGMQKTCPEAPAVAPTTGQLHLTARPAP